MFNLHVLVCQCTGERGSGWRRLVIDFDKIISLFVIKSVKIYKNEFMYHFECLSYESTAKRYQQKLQQTLKF